MDLQVQKTRSLSKHTRSYVALVAEGSTWIDDSTAINKTFPTFNFVLRFMPENNGLISSAL